MGGSLAAVSCGLRQRERESLFDARPADLGCQARAVAVRRFVSGLTSGLDYRLYDVVWCACDC